jgi:hypothetical protein
MNKTEENKKNITEVVYYYGKGFLSFGPECKLHEHSEGNNYTRDVKPLLMI